MRSPFRQHQEKVRAAMRANAARPQSAVAPAPVTDAYRLKLVELGEDLRRLSDIQSIEAKIAAKADMIGKYADWIAGVLDAATNGVATDDEIVTTMLVWNIDLGNWSAALALAEHVLTHGLSLPERYKRTPATLIAEEIADTALADRGRVDRDTLMRVEALTDSHDMPDQVRAKLHKALGRAFAAEAETFDDTAENAVAGGKLALIGTALGHLKRALKLHDAVGVKKDIERLERAWNRLNVPAA